MKQKQYEHSLLGTGGGKFANNFSSQHIAFTSEIRKISSTLLCEPET